MITALSDGSGTIAGVSVDVDRMASVFITDRFGWEIWRLEPVRDLAERNYRLREVREAADLQAFRAYWIRRSGHHGLFEYFDVLENRIRRPIPDRRPDYPEQRCEDADEWARLLRVARVPLIAWWDDPVRWNIACGGLRHGWVGSDADLYRTVEAIAAVPA